MDGPVKGPGLEKILFCSIIIMLALLIKGVATMVFKNDKVSAEFKGTDDVIVSLRGVYSKE